jgi:hypothetical protein
MVHTRPTFGTIVRINWRFLWAYLWGGDWPGSAGRLIQGCGGSISSPPFAG